MESVVQAEVMHTHRVKEDVTLYSRIMACIGLVSDDRALETPNRFDEWTAKVQAKEEMIPYELSFEVAVYFQ